MKKIIIISAIILLSVGIVLCGVGLATAGFDLKKLGYAEYHTTTYAADGEIDWIFIEESEADIEILLSEDDKARVVCDELDKISHVVTVEDGLLKISLEDERDLTDRIMVFSKSLYVKVYLPKKDYDDLKIVSATGNVTIAEKFSFKNASVSLSTGDVRFKNLSANKIDVSVTTGKISFENVVCAGAVDIKCGTGRSSYTNVSAYSFALNGGTGNVKLKEINIKDALVARLGTGDVDLDSIDAGSIKIVTTTGDVKGTIRSGKTFTAKTSTGKVSVPASDNDGGVCEITTTTGDIKIEIK